MTQATMPSSPPTTGGRSKFIIGGVILLAAVVYLIVNAVINQQEYFITVNRMVESQSQYVGKDIRISGAVIGDTIEYDGSTLSFEIVHIPDSAAEIEDEGGLAEVLHEATTNPDAKRVKIMLFDEPMPDLLQHEAQAIVTGTLGEDGIFYADELLLKCPTRYEEAVPEQTSG